MEPKSVSFGVGQVASLELYEYTCRVLIAAGQVPVLLCWPWAPRV